jgi:Cell wall-active antibiotics response 4TMS YvqF
VRPSQTLRAVMSSTERRGPWVVPRQVRVRALMSSTVLDFREARLPAGSVEIDLRAIMSSTEIIVPPGLAVETEGVAIMGSFEHVDRAPAHPDPDAPLLRVRGLAFMSSVEIKMRLPGETERDAHRRLRQERRGGKALPGR